MSLVNPRPNGWSVTDDLASAEANVFGQEIAKALDKSTVGDTLSGVVALASTGQITVPFANGLQTQAAGGFTLGGGSSDWPTFVAPGTSTPAPRTRTIWLPGDAVAGVTASPFPPTTAPAQPYQGAANIVGVALGYFTTTAVSDASITDSLGYYLPLRPGISLHHGATLTSATLWLKAFPHSALPNGSLPSFGIFRASPAAGITTLLSTGVGLVTDPSASTGAYTANHTITFTANQNNVIDTSQYSYFAVILDECGTSNTEVGNTFYGIQLNFGNVLTMAFP